MFVFFCFLGVFCGLSTSSPEPVLDFARTCFSDPGKAFVDASGMAHIYMHVDYFDGNFWGFKNDTLEIKYTSLKTNIGLAK